MLGHLHNISFKYAQKSSALSHRRVNILQDINLIIQTGEFLALAGPNGSGKTTLLKIIAGLLKPSTGQVELKLKPAAIAYVAQTSELPPLTVRQMVSLGRAPWQSWLGLASQHDLAICESALEQLNLIPLANIPVTELSGGEQQRVLLARALCQTPQLLLLDEPTSALDLTHQSWLITHLRQLSQSGLTIIMVCHDLNLSALADRICLLQAGQIKACASPQQVLQVELLQQVYSCPLLVDINPCTQKPLVLPLC